MAGLGEFDNRIRKSFQKEFFFQGFIEKAVLSVSEEEKEKERVREDSIRADYKHKSPLCPLHSNLDSDVVQ